MSLPVDLGIIDVYAGDPKTLILIFAGVDYTPKSFRSQIRPSASTGNVLLEWGITKLLVNGTDTQLTLRLTGDSAFGQVDGQTRQIGDTAVFDLQMIGSSNVPEETLCTGRLAVTKDVTR